MEKRELPHLAPGLDESLEDLGAGDLEVDHNGGQGGLGQLAGVVHRVAVQHYQLHGSGELEDSLNLSLHLQPMATV